MSSILTVIGFVTIGLALVLSGVLGSGDRIRANYTHEVSEDRNSRFKICGILLLIGIISFVLNYFFYY